MATVRVLEYDTINPVTGDPVGPPSKTTDVAVPGNMTLRSPTRSYTVSADANCRMGIGEAAAAHSCPIISAIDNPYEKGSGAALTLNFIAE